VTFAPGCSTQVGGPPNADNPRHYRVFLSCWFTNYDRVNTNGGPYKPAPLGWKIADAVALPVTMPVGICLAAVNSGPGAAHSQHSSGEHLSQAVAPGLARVARDNAPVDALAGDGIGLSLL
jgi:hypothetical protein